MNDSTLSPAVSIPEEAPVVKEHAYPKFHQGQIINIQGAFFRVNTLTKKCVSLQCLPGTTIEETKIDQLKKLSQHHKNLAQESYIERQKLLGIVLTLVKKHGAGLLMPGADRTVVIPFDEATTLHHNEHLNITPNLKENTLTVTVVKQE